MTMLTLTTPQGSPITKYQEWTRPKKNTSGKKEGVQWSWPDHGSSDGEKQYAYHPDHERLSRCIGNDIPHLCLSCGNEFMIDSLSPITRCRKCNSGDISETFLLEEKTCPVCNKGILILDPTQHPKRHMKISTWYILFLQFVLF